MQEGVGVSLCTWWPWAHEDPPPSRTGQPVSSALTTGHLAASSVSRW